MECMWIVRPDILQNVYLFQNPFWLVSWVLGASVLWFRIHAGLPGVLGEARQCDQEEDDAADE